MRDRFRDKDGFISLPYEIVAGGCVSRVYFMGTNLSGPFRAQICWNAWCLGGGV